MRRADAYHRQMAEDWSLDGQPTTFWAGVRIPVQPKLEEFPEVLGGLSVLELRDGNAECRHGRCAFDRSPPCGCHTVEKGGPVTALPAKQRAKGRKAA